MSIQQPNQQILNLNPYKPGMPIDELVRKYKLNPQAIIKAASNENSLGCSPAVAETIKLAAKGVHLYPDQYFLRQTIAGFHNLDNHNVTLGNGSNDVIDLIARTYLTANSESISSQYAFIIYRLVSTIAGAKNIITPAKNYGHDLTAMLAAITDKTKVIWIANPNNPTGTFIAYSEISDFLDKVPEHIIVVLDEAYYEYLDDNSSINSPKLLDKYQNLIILRTFSKIYGLAGLRIGYGLASSEISDYLNRVRHPFNVNSVGIEAARTALSEQQHVAQCRDHTINARQQFENELTNMGVEFIPSYANFISIRLNDVHGVHGQLLRSGIITRPLTEYGLDNHLRISIGADQENDSIIAQLRIILSA